MQNASNEIQALTLTDDQLIEAIQQGSQLAFRTLYHRFAASVHQTAFYMLQSKEEAEDATQQVFVNIWNSLDSFRGDAKLNTWIYRITVTECLGIIRKKNRKKRFAWLTGLEDAEEIQTETPTPEWELINREQLEEIQLVLSELVPNQRAAFVLHYFEDLNYDDAAQSLELSVSAYTALLYRAKQNVKTALQKSATFAERFPAQKHQNQ